MYGLRLVVLSLVYNLLYVSLINKALFKDRIRTGVSGFRILRANLYTTKLAQLRFRFAVSAFIFKRFNITEFLIERLSYAAAPHILDSNQF